VKNLTDDVDMLGAQRPRFAAEVLIVVTYLLFIALYSMPPSLSLGRPWFEFAHWACLGLYVTCVIHLHRNNVELKVLGFLGFQAPLIYAMIMSGIDLSLSFVLVRPEYAGVDLIQAVFIFLMRVTFMLSDCLCVQTSTFRLLQSVLFVLSNITSIYTAMFYDVKHLFFASFTSTGLKAACAITLIEITANALLLISKVGSFFFSIFFPSSFFPSFFLFFVFCFFILPGQVCDLFGVCSL
jgi:hypothetical protein